MTIAFRQPGSFREIKDLADFLWQQNLGYSNYDDWVLQARDEIDGGYKTAIVAYDDKTIVGNIVFQPHKELAGVREIKNLRVAPDFRCRRFGSFLLRQCEWHNHCFYSSLMTDFREGQSEVEKLLIEEGFQIVAARNLYDDQMDKIAVRVNRYRKACQ